LKGKSVVFQMLEVVHLNQIPIEKNGTRSMVLKNEQWGRRVTPGVLKTFKEQDVKIVFSQSYRLAIL
jgi:hypothetical protein